MNKHFYTIAALILITAISGCGKKSTPTEVDPGGDKTPPTVTASYPPGDTIHQFIRNQVIAITFSEAMKQSSVPGAFSANGVPGTFYWQGNEVTFVPDAAFAANETVKVSITGNATDLADNGLLPAFSKWYLTSALLDTTAPTVSSHQPPSAATNVAIGTDVTAYASEVLSDWSTNAIVLKDSAGANVTGNKVLGLNDSILQFSPSANLKYNTLYTVTIDTTLRDLCWNHMQVPYTWSFRTELDTVKPAVVSTYPAAGDTAITVNTSITVRFSEPMNKATAQAALSLVPTAAFSGYIWQGDTLMTAALAETLSFKKQYRISVNTTALDANGNQLAASYSGIFTTGRGLLVACNTGNKIYCYQLSDMKNEGSLNLSSPRQIRISSDDSIAYILTSNSLNAIQLKNKNLLLGSLALPTTCYGMTLSPTGARMAVSISGEDRVIIINTSTMQTTDTIAVGDTPTGIAYSADGSYVYVTLNQGTRVERYNLSTHAMDWVTITIGGEEAVISQDGGRLFVTNGSYVTVISASTFAALYNINNVSSRPFGLAVSPDGTHLAVSCYTEGLVKVYSATAASETAPLAQIIIGTGSQPKSLCYSPDGKYLYVSNSGSSSVSVISRNGNGYTLSSTLTVGAGPWGIAVTP